MKLKNLSTKIRNHLNGTFRKGSIFIPTKTEGAILHTALCLNYITKANGETTEINVVFITQKGIFVLENKNYSRWILGNEMQRYWTASLVNDTKNSFYNPVLQGKVHIKWLDSFLHHETPLFSIIAFSEGRECNTPHYSKHPKIIPR